MAATLFDELSLTMANKVLHKSLNATDDNVTDAGHGLYALSDLLQDAFYAEKGTDFQTHHLANAMIGDSTISGVVEPLT